MRIVVGEGSCGIAAGARKVRAAIEAFREEDPADVEVGVTGCIGMCYLEPIVDLYAGGRLAARLVRVGSRELRVVEFWGGVLRWGTILVLLGAALRGKRRGRVES